MTSKKRISKRRLRERRVCRCLHIVVLRLPLTTFLHKQGSAKGEVWLMEYVVTTRTAQEGKKRRRDIDRAEKTVRAEKARGAKAVAGCSKGGSRGCSKGGS